MKVLAAFAGALLAIVLPATAAAGSTDLLFGQQHSYTVTMRGNGEAVVLARITFTNTGDQPQKTFSFQIPGSAEPSELAGFQQEYQQVCNRYGAPEPVTTPLSKSGVPVTTLPNILPCLQYETPDISQSLDGQNVKYEKVKFNASAGNNYKVTLPTPVAAQQSSSLLLSYSSMGYAHKSLGSYTFNFETIKVGQRTSRSDVAVSVDSDQYLEGKGSVSYQPKAVDNGAVSAQATQAAPSAAALNQVSDSLGQGGEVDKSASNLAPGDTLTVKGRYASSSLLLRLPGLLATLGFLLLAVVIALVFRKRIMKHIRIYHRKGPQPTVATLATNPAAHTAQLHSQVASAGNILAGLVSALGICGLTWFVTWYTQSASPDPFTTLIVAITAIVAYILFALGPGVYLAATSRDWRRLVYAVMFEVLFLLAFVVIYAVAIAPLLNPPNQAVPVMGGGCRPSCQ